MKARYNFFGDGQVGEDGSKTVVKKPQSSAISTIFHAESNGKSLPQFGSCKFKGYRKNNNNEYHYSIPFFAREFRQIVVNVDGRS